MPKGKIIALFLLVGSVVNQEGLQCKADQPLLQSRSAIEPNPELSFQPPSEPSPSPEPSPSETPTESLAKFPLECFQKGISLGLITYQAIRLCTNAKSLDPLQCLIHSYSGMTGDQRVALCQGAQSQAPNQCFHESANLFLTFDQQIKLCNGASFRNGSISSIDAESTGPVLCFRKAVSLPIVTDQKITLCANAESDDPVRCFVGADFLNLSFDQRVHLCTLSPPTNG